ncbi:MAG: ADP-ribosylglycohydrolase family protein [Candidatus Amulumruptor caecigallinarius]|nr:ADP-ribosylglycohydrolase family protein [Candidatus Amulumruptor caecigallinarius]
MKLNDRIKGCIFGYALGDALGVGTEFMSKKEAAIYYPDKLRSFKQIIRDSHRSQWEQGEWTNDTEIVARMLESIMEHQEIKETAISKSLWEWVTTGVNDLSSFLYEMMYSEEWRDNPIQMSHRTWAGKKNPMATNEATGRAVVVALTAKESEIRRDTARLVLLTHDDSRCVYSTEVLARALRKILFEQKDIAYEEVAHICAGSDGRLLPYVETAMSDDIEALDLDDEESSTYTRKTMSAGLWALWHCDNPADMIYKMIDEGGDADTNAAIAGALAGAKFGYDALPDEKRELKQFGYLESLSERIADYMQQHVLK